MNFHDTNLPKYIEICMVGLSKFSTSIAESMSGREVRSLDSHIPKRHYVLRDCRLSADQFESFNNFFYARGGRRFSFRLRDYFDCKVEKEIVAISDGINTEFQLQKTYMDEVSPYIRIITKPVIATVQLWLGENNIKPKFIDQNNGKIIFIDPPPKGEIIYASFTFDIPVRFDTDIFSYKFNEDGTILIEDIELIEIYE